MKIELRGLQNPFKKQLKRDTASEEAFEPQFYRKIMIFQWFFASKTEPKSKKKCWKCDAQKQCFFKSIFIGIFFVLASENGMKFHCFLDLYRKSWFCENHCFSNGKWLFFRFGASNDRPKVDTKTQSKITSKNKARTSNFRSHLGFPKPSKSTPKAMLNEACFATLWKPPASRRKSTGVATSGLRNWLCIWLGLFYLSIYWSAPRRPNHQSKVCNLTCSTHISAQWTKESKNIVQRHSNPWKSSSEGLKIHSKSSFKAILLQRRPSNLNFFEKLWFFNDFWLPKRSPNPRKKVENAMLKNNASLNRFLLEFSSLWLPKMEWKFNVFWIFIEKTDFVKIIVFLKENGYFSGFELPKIDKISMSKLFRKWHRKKRILNRIWASIRVSQNH